MNFLLYMFHIFVIGWILTIWIVRLNLKMIECGLKLLSWRKGLGNKHNFGISVIFTLFMMSIHTEFGLRYIIFSLDGREKYHIVGKVSFLIYIIWKAKSILLYYDSRPKSIFSLFELLNRYLRVQSCKTYARCVEDKCL